MVVGCLYLKKVYDSVPCDALQSVLASSTKECMQEFRLAVMLLAALRFKVMVHNGSYSL